jgi:hypothetical protein
MLVTPTAPRKPHQHSYKAPSFIPSDAAPPHPSPRQTLSRTGVSVPQVEIPDRVRYRLGQSTEMDQQRHDRKLGTLKSSCNLHCTAGMSVEGVSVMAEFEKCKERRVAGCRTKKMRLPVVAHTFLRMVQCSSSVCLAINH